jgi:hypothetical protein
MANTEVGAGPALIFTYYVGFGAFLALITLRDNRLELAIGANAANNLFVALVVNRNHSSLPTRAIWQTADIHPTVRHSQFPGRRSSLLLAPGTPPGPVNAENGWAAPGTSQLLLTVPSSGPATLIGHLGSEGP